MTKPVVVDEWQLMWVKRIDADDGYTYRHWRAAEITDEMIEHGVKAMNDRVLANPSHGAWWGDLEEQERETWREAVWVALSAALGREDST